MSRVVGIDLGTTGSALAVVKDGVPVTVATGDGQRIPSVVAFTKNGQLLSGQAARRQATVNAENTVFSIKRLLGRRYEEVQAETDRLPYRLSEGPQGDVRITLPYASRKLTPQEIAAVLIHKLKQEAEAALGESVNQAVITVPAYFNDSQRQAMKVAAKIAGLDVLQIINDPTAAALTYDLERKQTGRIMVFDLGGGSLDVSILDVRDGAIAVRATSGDADLGGDDWDAVIASWILDQFLRQHGIDLSHDRQALQRVHEAAEEAKIALSEKTETQIHLPFIIANGAGPKHLRLTLTRRRLDALTAHLLERLEVPVRQVLTDARLEPSDLSAILLVGGASRTPAVRQRVQNLTGREPVSSVNPEEAVVLGAALQAGALGGQVQNIHLEDVTPLSLGVETMGGMMSIVIPRNTPLPVRRSYVFSTAEDRQTVVDIHVLQGERPMAADNNSLGIFRLEGIAPAPRGIPQIEVTFALDADGLLQVSARDQTTGSSEALSVRASDLLADAEVSRIVAEAQRCAAGDEQRRKLVEARTLAEQIIYQTERTLQHLNGQVAAASQRCLEQRISRLARAIEAKDVDKIRRLTADIQEVAFSLEDEKDGFSGGGQTQSP
jgi:molecular chaperone DnaK